METLQFVYDAERKLTNRAHVGAVGSGDLEILIEPSSDRQAHVYLRTSVEGFESTWKAVFDKFFYLNKIAVSIHINDFGATPGVVSLRLAQALEVLEN